MVAPEIRLWYGTTIDPDDNGEPMTKISVSRELGLEGVSFRNTNSNNNLTRDNRIIPSVWYGPTKRCGRGMWRGHAGYQPPIATAIAAGAGNTSEF